MAHQYSAGFEKVARVVIKRSRVVVGFWIALAIVVSLAWAPLEDVAARKAASPMPKESQSIQAMTAMAEKFQEDGNLNSAIIVMSDSAGFTEQARARYSATVERLRGRPDAVANVQDVLGDPVASSSKTVRSQVMSDDGKAWILLVGMVGELGSPSTMASLEVVRDIVGQTFAGSTTTAKVTGPTATVGDVAEGSLDDMKVVGIITFVLIASILLLVYRSVFTAALPVMVLGASVVVARGVVAGLSEVGLPISTMSSMIMIAILAGASVNYTVFMISRYHENLRAGEDPVEALAHAGGSMSRVILATAATVAVANLAQLTAKLDFLAAAGPAVAIAISVGFLSAITLLPAVLALAAKRGWGLARPDRSHVYWAKIGKAVVARPALTLVGSLVVLGALAASALFMNIGYDDRAVQPSDTESAEGYALMDAHFQRDTMIPQYVLVESQKDLRSPQALADLDQMAARIAQLPGIKRVVGVTRPDGKKLTQATLAWQISMMGDQLANAGRRSPAVKRRLAEIREFADAIDDLAGPESGFDVEEMTEQAESMLGMARGAAAQMDSYASIVAELGESADQIDNLAAVSPMLIASADALKNVRTTVLPALDSPACRGIRECAKVRSDLSPVLDLARDGQLDRLSQLARSLSVTAGREDAKDQIRRLSDQFEQARGALAQIPEWETRLSKVRDLVGKLKKSGVDLSDPSAMTTQARTLADQATRAMSAMTGLAAYLQTTGRESATDNASGFYLPAALIDSSDFSRMASAFISPDGHAVRFIVQSTVNPFSADAMDLAAQMADVGRAATPNTALAGTTVSVGGYPAVNNDLQTMFQRDFAEIVIVTLLVILLVMCLLLRAIVAPLYLLATVVLTYGSAIGLGVLIFQVIGGQDIYWAVPAMAFTMVVAVGADYNMLFVARLREHAVDEPKDAILPTVVSTGSVITSAGLIFASAMFGMMAGSISTAVQMGFIIGAGILIDTFIVRTITVPAIVAIVGRRSWWPSRQ
ncbi:MMPL family transporter [Gordonia sp. (in: high G+C Gram-positive bacteria)]|uniref:MMPL family transporter n=1 Tax=Gordonia sp. (in: high G+C Gram-positive bacteria) TaxID=84139 RepID=UPI0033422C4C